MTSSSRTGARERSSNSWYYGWNIVLLSIVFQAVTLGLTAFSFTFWIAPIADTLQVPRAQVLLAATAWQLGVALYSPFLGRILDRFPLRSIVPLGALSFGLGYLLVSVATEVWVIIAAYAVLLPLGSILAGAIGANVAVVRWFKWRRGTALGMSAVGTSLGGVIFPPVVTYLIASHGWRTAHLWLAGGTLLVLLPLILLVVRDRRAHEHEPGEPVEASAKVEAEPAPANENVPWTTWQIVTNITFLKIAAYACAILFVSIAIQYNVAPIAASVGVGAKDAAFMVSAEAVAMVFGNLAFGASSDKFDHRILLAAVAVLLIVCLGILQAAGSYPALFFSFILLGAVKGGIAPMQAAVVAQRFGVANLGRVAGMLSPVMLVAALGPVLFSQLATQFGGYEEVITLYMILLVPAVLAAFLLGPPRMERAKSEDKGGEGLVGSGSFQSERKI